MLRPNTAAHKCAEISEKLLAVIDALEASRNGTFIDQHGYTMEW
jgi:hypothetical protein